MLQKTVIAAWVLLVLAAVIFGACSNSSLFGSPRAWPGTAWTRYGHQVPYSVVDAAAGPSQCGWESATFLTVGWPLGTSAQHATQARQYIRDSSTVVPQSNLRSKLELDARLPTDARNTGYRDGSVQLYLAASDEDAAIYVVADGRVERWPRSDPMTVCS
jgi:hypothetical protein